MSSTDLMRVSIAAVVLASLAATARAQHAISFPDPERYELENGLEVVLDPVQGRREVTVLVSYRVGMRDQPAGWTGLAHLVEHLMFEGSLHVPEDSFIPSLERAGSLDRNAVTLRDSTDYFQTVPSERLEQVLFLESDRMAFLLSTLDEESVAGQRLVVERERIERRAISGRGALPAMVARGLYPEGHPYRDVEEVPAHLAQVRLPQVQWFVQSYYQPANATLVISGGFDRTRTRAWIERWFGSIRRSAPLPRRREVERVRLAGERHVTVEADVPTDELQVIWPTPAYFAPGDAELDVVAHILEERLRLALVERGSALAVGCRQSSRELVSELSIVVRLGRGQGTDQALAVVDAELARFAQGIDEALVRRVREVWFDRLIERMERSSSRAGLLASRVHDGSGYTVARDARRYARVDAERAARAVRVLLPRDRRFVLSVRANPRAPEGGRVVSDQLRRSAP